MLNKNINYRSYLPKIFGCALILMLGGLYLINRNEEPRESFNYQKGTISYISNINPYKSKSGPRPKDVYLKLNEFDSVFELFTGKDKGDFTPRVDRLNELTQGDLIEVYYEENTKTNKGNVNRLLQYLDKDGELYYLRSNADEKIGYSIICCSGLLIILGVYISFKY